MPVPTDEQLDDLAALLVPRLSAIADRTEMRHSRMPDHLSLGVYGRHEWLSDREAERRLVEMIW